MKTKSKAPDFTKTVEAWVDVDIDADDLHEAGWHHATECSLGADAHEPEDPESLGPAVASLHRQAHPREPRSVRLCHEEPCRSLSLEQYRQADA